MNIAVCIKQVPWIDQVRFDPERKTIVREGVNLLMNSLDRRALTEAIRTRERFGGQITVLTMGPPQARDILIEALATGADRAIHLQDRAFAGADTLATARALARALQQAGPFDLIFCGRFSIDAETGQVGPEVAELLDLPQATNIQAAEFDAAGRTVRVRRETEEGVEVLDLPLPALLTAGEWLNRPLRPTPDQVAAAQERPVETWTAADLGGDPALFGMSGSPTYVTEVRTLPNERAQVRIDGSDPDAAAAQLVEYLVRRGLFTPWQRAVPRAVALRQKDSDPARAVWVMAETALGRLKHVTLELLGKATDLADRLQGEVAAVLVGSGVAGLVGEAAAYGADRVYVADSPALAHFDTETYARVLSNALQVHQPAAVLFPATVNGRDLAPRIAARLGLGLTGDCIDLEIDGDGRLVQLKPAFGGNIVAPILSRTRPALATVRPGVFQRLTPDPARQAAVVTLPVPAASSGRVRFVESLPIQGASGVDLDDAEVVVGVGNGIGTPEHLPLLHDLARALGGTIAASLRAVANGILPGPLQVGLTGRAIAPRFYLAVGIRGTLTHMMGVQKAETIIAINQDPDAEIFTACDVGIVGDFRQIVPALTRAVVQARAAGK
ncbi:MAG: electron transfer flavoprotein alpha/ beta subunit [Chloroflexi bacterium]|nr:electron transfer flavoprotein alpha/ beta subunit [Chloroflexota bacterium]